MCYIYSSIDRLFRGITTFQCGSVFRRIPAGIKTQRFYVRPLSTAQAFRRSQLRNITHFVSTFVWLHFTLSYTGVLNSLEELCITRMAVFNSLAKVLKRFIYTYIYIYIYIYIYRERERERERGDFVPSCNFNMITQFLRLVELSKMWWT